MNEGTAKFNPINTRSRADAGILRGAAKVMEKDMLSSYNLANFERASPMVKTGCSFIATI